MNGVITITCYPSPTPIGRPNAKKGNEDTVPSVLYVARLELYSRGAGSGPSVGEPCNVPGLQQKDAQYEKPKSNAVITLIVPLKLEGLLITHRIIHENAHLQ